MYFSEIYSIFSQMASFIFYTSSKSWRSLCPTLYMQKYSRRDCIGYFAHSNCLKAINYIVTNHVVFYIQSAIIIRPYNFLHRICMENLIFVMCFKIPLINVMEAPKGINTNKSHHHNQLVRSAPYQPVVSSHSYTQQFESPILLAHQHYYTSAYSYQIYLRLCNF